MYEVPLHEYTSRDTVRWYISLWNTVWDSIPVVYKEQPLCRGEPVIAGGSVRDFLWHIWHTPLPVQPKDIDLFVTDVIGLPPLPLPTVGDCTPQAVMPSTAHYGISRCVYSYTVSGIAAQYIWVTGDVTGHICDTFDLDICQVAVTRRDNIWYLQSTEAAIEGIRKRRVRIARLPETFTERKKTFERAHALAYRYRTETGIDLHVDMCDMEGMICCDMLQL